MKQIGKMFLVSPSKKSKLVFNKNNQQKSVRENFALAISCFVNHSVMLWKFSWIKFNEEITPEFEELSFQWHWTGLFQTSGKNVKAELGI